MTSPYTAPGMKVQKLSLEEKVLTVIKQIWELNDDEIINSRKDDAAQARYFAVYYLWSHGYTWDGAHAVFYRNWVNAKRIRRKMAEFISTGNDEKIQRALRILNN